MKKWFACLAVAGLLFSAGVGVSHAESWYPLIDLHSDLSRSQRDRTLSVRMIKFTQNCVGE